MAFTPKANYKPKEPEPAYGGSGIGVKKNILGQNIVAEAPKAAAAPTPKISLSGGEMKVNSPSLIKSSPAVADSPASPRSQAAKLMKRQAGIGQLKTYHVPTAEELL